MTDPTRLANAAIPARPVSDPRSVVPANWRSETSPEADALPPTQPGPAGAETDSSGETDEAGH